MNNEKKSNSIAPIAIIGAVLAAAVIGFWWFYSSATSQQPAKTAANASRPGAANSAELYQKASPGAVPPNYLGAPNAAVTIEEFADFQCSACAAMHPMVQELRAAYGDRVRIIFRQFPLSIPAHDKAYDAAVAAEAAGLQGRFWDMQNLLFANQQTWGRSPNHRKLFEEYAQRISLDVARFSNDMIGIPAKNRVDADLQRGRSLNVGSTPTFYINGKPVGTQSMTLAGMRQVIDAELQRTQGR
jgi:protein-disulfide isomerase